MSYYDDQEDAWFENDCKGRIEDYDPYDADSWLTPKEKPTLSNEDRKILQSLNAEAKGKGLRVFFHGNGHFQVRAGRKVVNWYPASKKQTAYENITGEKRFGLTPKQVVEFALEKVKVEV